MYEIALFENSPDIYVSIFYNSKPYGSILDLF